MRSLSLCSGYGGLDLAVETALGAKTAACAEIDKKAASVFARHWPYIPNLGDITAVEWNPNCVCEWEDNHIPCTPYHQRGRCLANIDIITAGYPCQPFSHAGKRGGDTDERHLWPAIRNAVRLLRPGYLVCENVRGHLSLGFDRVLGDLAGLGYCVRWTVVRAADVGAPHGRARLFFVAQHTSPGPSTDAANIGHERRGSTRRGWAGPADHREPPADAKGIRRNRCERQDTEPQRQSEQQSRAVTNRLCEVAWGDYTPAIHRWASIIGRPAPFPTDERGRLSPFLVEWMMGLPLGWVTDTPGLSRADMLKILGNGVVPQQAQAAIATLLQPLAAAS